MAPTPAFFAPVLEATETLLVPSLCVFEVCKRIALQRGEVAAQQAAEYMAQGKIILVGANTAIAAALYSDKHKLPMANSLILITAQEHQATLWTQDANLKSHKSVKYEAKTA